MVEILPVGSEAARIACIRFNFNRLGYSSFVSHQDNALS
jgi:hypothetical protein